MYRKEMNMLRLGEWNRGTMREILWINVRISQSCFKDLAMESLRQKKT